MEKENQPSTQWWKGHGEEIVYGYIFLDLQEDPKIIKFMDKLDDKSKKIIYKNMVSSVRDVMLFIYANNLYVKYFLIDNPNKTEDVPPFLEVSQSYSLSLTNLINNATKLGVKSLNGLRAVLAVVIECDDQSFLDDPKELFKRFNILFKDYRLAESENLPYDYTVQSIDDLTIQ